MSSIKPYSYREDASVPYFPDDHPLLILDGYCVLCTGGAAKLMQWDKKAKFRYIPAQSDIGLSILKHYNINWDDTFLLLDKGIPYTKSKGYLKVAQILGGIWLAGLVFHAIPKCIADKAYDLIAKRRYKWFGTTDYCSLLPDSYKDRIISGKQN